MVLISRYNPATDEVTEFSASSCLTLLRSVDRCSVTTSEGIGNQRRNQGGASRGHGPPKISENF